MELQAAWTRLSEHVTLAKECSQTVAALAHHRTRRGQIHFLGAVRDVLCCGAVNGSATYGAYRFENVINNNVNGLNVNGQAMNFYWQHTPQARTPASCCTTPAAPSPITAGSVAGHSALSDV